MGSVLLSAASFMLIILIGIFLRKWRIVPDDAGTVVKKLTVDLVLPCAIILNFSKMESLPSSMILLTVLGAAANIFMIAVGVLCTRKQPVAEQALHIFCLPALNIGAFCLPFVQNFLPASAVVAACMFDVGNSLMCTGVTYAFASVYLSVNKQGFSFSSFAKKLFSSPLFVTYLVMFFLSILGIRLPETFVTLITPIASASTFCCMLMLGLLFHLEFKKEYLGDICRVLALRQIFAVCLALLCYFVLPFDLVTRQTLTLLAFAPFSTVAPAYTGMCGGDEGKASSVGSISIVLSVLELTGLLILLGIY